jgi:predicted nucleotide-binding protein
MSSMTYSGALRDLRNQLKTDFPLADDAFYGTLKAFDKAVGAMSEAWSGSNIGYQANVYYKDFMAPLPGDHFSKEWGLSLSNQSETGWREYPREQIIGKIRALASGVNLGDALAAAERVRGALKLAKSEAESILSSYLAFTDDGYIENLNRDIHKLSAPSADLIAREMLPRGPEASRDAVAAGQGLQLAEHQKTAAKVSEVRRAFAAYSEMIFLLDRAANHIDRRSVAPTMAGRQIGESVFIGHGRSPLWRELKDFVSDRLKLPWDEFNRVPVAGVATTVRLSQMLDRAAFALLIMTAEDETADGKLQARQNVIHEVGLFQGRLGFERAIIMLEEGCEDFSNVDGLSQIRFPKGNISAKFEEVRQVLEREGLLE